MNFNSAALDPEHQSTGTSCNDVCGTDLCTAESEDRQTNLIGDDLMAVARDCFGIERESATTGEPLPPAQQIASSANNRAWPGVFYARNVLQVFFFRSANHRDTADNQRLCCCAAESSQQLCCKNLLLRLLRPSCR